LISINGMTGAYLLFNDRRQGTAAAPCVSGKVLIAISAPLLFIAALQKPRGASTGLLLFVHLAGVGNIGAAHERCFPFRVKAAAGPLLACAVIPA
jgi:hypothetical protein